MSRIGLIVNPIAGMGGRVGLKGTDGAEVLARARALGATPLAGERTDRALARLEGRGIEIVAAAGELGADLALAHGLETEALPRTSAPGATGSEDTRSAAAELARRGVDLILFAGGDGTLRDVHAAVGGSVPVLGIPTGVKMHSAAFATSPENAGEVAATFLADGLGAALREVEVIDLDEDAYRADRIETRLYGSVRVPADRLRMQAAKARSGAADDVALDAVCHGIAAAMDPRRIYLLGPGTTTKRIAEHLGLPKTLLGVDAVRAGRLLGADLGERELLDVLDGHAATLILGVVGGQGALLGRGNQQLSPAVLRRVGAANVEVVAGLAKLLALDPPCLRVDTGDPGLDAELQGYRRIHVAPRRTHVLKVAA